MQLETGKILEGKVTGITKFGAFVELGEGVTGMVHISEVAPTFVKEIRDYLSENQMVKVKVLNVGDDGKVSLSIKRVTDSRAPAPTGGRPPRRDGDSRREGGWEPKRQEPPSFEDMMSKFKQNSEEKMSDLKRIMDNKRGPASRRSGPR